MLLSPHLPSSYAALSFTKPSNPKPLVLCFSSPNPNPSTLQSSSADADPVAASAIRRIADKLRSLGYLDDSSPASTPTAAAGPGTAGEIFVPTPAELPRYRVGATLDASWSSPGRPVPAPGAGLSRFHGLWRREGDLRSSGSAPAPADASPSVAELTLRADELRRLRREGIRLGTRIKVGKAGITEGIVNSVHERWQRSEVVKIKCEDLCRINMKRTHEILERKTGGLVIWRSGSTLILYRGANYKYPYFLGDPDDQNPDAILLEPNSELQKGQDAIPNCESNGHHDIELINAKSDGHHSIELINGQEEPRKTEQAASARTSLVPGVGSPNKFRLQFPGEVELTDEADKLLEGLGPRFTDWWGFGPLPVDADLLPAVVPGFRKPFRLLPFGIQPKLTDSEMTTMRRLGRPLPCHFALGRNRKLQGLAVSMIKLWERCEIAKIAVKRGVQNTNSEIMAEELKNLTGGTLLSRDKEFIVFYRGKDFLPLIVSDAIEKRRTNMKFSNNDSKQSEHNSSVPVSAGSSDEFHNKQDKSTIYPKDEPKSDRALKSAESKLSQAIAKKERAEILLAKLEDSADSMDVVMDKEAISEEERYMLRKVGLRMKPFLLLGRRGVFDGTVENMHLHWKYRELVKIICRERSLKDIQHAAQTLEAESGGILVAVERVNKGHAIIIYRGKNYRRPATLRPKTLLNKREAMKRSLEAQRYQSLKLSVLNLSKDIEKMKLQMTSGNVPSYQEGIHTEHENPQNVSTHLYGSSTASPGKYESETEISLTPQLASYFDEDTRDMSTAGELRSEVQAVHSSHELEQVSTSPKSVSHSIDDADAATSEGVTSEKRESHGDDTNQAGGSENEVPFRAARLSNKERLILRKQALMMRKRPVLAVGRNNVITGVAKTIKTHFRKHPLAIVNIKGRAEGTPVQQLIFELEEATGAVLVSREPNKVILYRGWGKGETPGGAKVDAMKEDDAEPAISPKLMEAIRLECGLH